MGTASFDHEPGELDSITPGKLDELVAYPLEALSADHDALLDPCPAFTVVGGKPKHDPEHRLARWPALRYC